MAQHPFIAVWDRIASLNITTQEKAILWCLARHGDWADGSHSYPSQATIGREVGLSERQVQWYLKSLRCDPYDALQGQCRDAKCQHRGLIAQTAPSSRYEPAMYALQLDQDLALQPKLPDIGKPREQRLSRTKRQCSVPGCQRPHLARGRCRKHYSELVRASA